jgi:hypothetical protein
VQALSAVVAAVAWTERGSIAERTRVGEPADGDDPPAQAAGPAGSATAWWPRAGRLAQPQAARILTIFCGLNA